MRRIGTYNLLVGVLLTLAAALRLGFVLTGPLPAIKKDALHYDDIARNLAAGKGYSLSYEHLLEGDRPAEFRPAPTARRSPLFPVFLACLFRIAGENYRLVQVIQALMGVLTCYLIFALSRAATARRDAALAALAMSAVYPPFIQYSRHLLTEVMFLLLTVGAFLAAYRAIEKGGLPRAAGAGVLGGLATLCRPTAIFFLPLHAFLLYVGRRRLGTAKAWRKEVLVYIAGFCVLMAPWVVRNYMTFNAFIPGFTSAGYNLFMGTYPPSRGLPNMDHAEFPPALNRELVGKGEVEADRIFRRAAVKNVMEHPLAYVKLVAMKTIRGWFGRWKDHDWLPSPRKAALHGSLLGLAIAGALIERKRRPLGVLFLAAGAVAFTGFHALVVSDPRYNLPAVPFAIMLAAAAITVWGRKLWACDEPHPSPEHKRDAIPNLPASKHT